MIKKSISQLLLIWLALTMPAIVFADTASLFLQADQAAKKGGYAQANFYYFKILADEPNNIEAQFGLARSFAMQKNYQRSRAELDKLFALNTRHQGGLLLSASLYLFNKEYQSALRDANAVIQHNPENVQAYRFLSSAYAGLGDEPAAKKAMDRSLQLSATPQ